MGALAGLLKEKGYRVTGSDQHVYPPMSLLLEQLGIPIEKGFDVTHLEPPPDLVVIGNAVSRGNPEVEATLNRQIPYRSLPEVIRDFFLQDKRSVVISGTHGKTTTTAIAAHLLHQAQLDPSFLIAGLPHNFPRPYRLGNGPYFIIEGDEYDSAFFAKFAKFFFYLPQTLVVNNIEFDHADIYRDLEEIERVFGQLINLIPQNGLILAASHDPVIKKLLPNAHSPVQTFGLEPEAYWRATEIESTPQGQHFTLSRQGEAQGRIELPLGGTYNIRNSLAAIGIGMEAGLSPSQISAGLLSFKGVRRRQEVVGRVAGITLIDDFAHHPTAVYQTLDGLRRSYPQRRLWAVFEPASATNARAVFTDRYIAAFAPADQIVLARILRPERAREDIPFKPEQLAKHLQGQGHSAAYIPDVAEIVSHLRNSLQSGDIVVFMSNGGFGGIQQKLLQSLQVHYGSAS